VISRFLEMKIIPMGVELEILVGKDELPSIFKLL
jgi:hypothetical protein